jgi:hypothetical protein
MNRVVPSSSPASKSCAGFDGGHFDVGAVFRLAFDHAHMVKIPGHGAHLALAEADTHIGSRAIGIVGQAFHHHGHAMGA